MKSLAEVLAPLSLEAFLRDTWERSFLRLTGQPGKFHRLFSWSNLGDVLATHRLPESRMRLVKKRTLIPSRRYLIAATGLVHDERVLVELRRGATLALDHAEEMSLPLRALVADIERLVASSVHANLYAAWGCDHGFGLHFDTQDTLILQIHGRKSWSVWRPTFPHPTQSEDARAPAPVEDPVWSGVISDGDLLYMPRGWWHSVQPINEPSLHLTVTIPCRTAGDLLRWLARELDHYEVARANLPLTADPDAQREYLDRLAAALRDVWGEDLLRRYLAQAAPDRMTPPRFAFPSLERPIDPDEPTGAGGAAPEPLVSMSEG